MTKTDMARIGMIETDIREVDQGIETGRGLALVLLGEATGQGMQQDNTLYTSYTYIYTIVVMQSSPFTSNVRHSYFSVSTIH